MVWKIFGLWSYSVSAENTPMWYPKYQIAVGILMHTFCPTIILLGLMARNLSETFAIAQVLATSMAGFKAWLCLRQPHLTQQLFQLLDELDSHHMQTKYEHVILRSNKIARQLTIFMGICYFCDATFFTANAYLQADKRALIYSMYVPFEYHESTFRYVAVLAYQTMMTYVVTILLLSTDMYSGSMYIVLAAHLKALEMRLQEIGNGNLDDANTKLSREQFQKNEMELMKCIQTHLLCIK